MGVKGLRLAQGLAFQEWEVCTEMDLLKARGGGRSCESSAFPRGESRESFKKILKKINREKKVSLR